MFTDIYKYEPGDIVYEIGRPQQLMTVTKRHGLIYHCNLVDSKNSLALVFMERDLKKTNLNLTLPKLANIG